MLTQTGVQKLVIVNGSTDVLGLVEDALDGGRYDVVFVEASDRAYSRIRCVQPHLVILCLRIEDTDGFRVLSMLKLDEATREIPVLTYTTEYEGQETEFEAPERPDDDDLISAMPALRMN